MNYSRRQLYALGEPLGDAVTRKVGGKVVYGGGGGGGGPTQQTVVQSNIPDWLRPPVETVLGGAMQQLFETQPGEDGKIDIKGVRPFIPYSANPADYVAGFSPLQQEAMSRAAGLQVPGQIGAASQMSGMAGQGGLEAARQAAGYGGAGYQSGLLGQQVGLSGAEAAAQRAAGAEQAAYDLGAAGLESGLAGQALGTEAQRVAAQQAQQAQQAAYGYGGAGYEAGLAGQALGAEAQQAAARQAAALQQAAYGYGGMGADYGGMGAGYGAQAAGLAPQAQMYGGRAADIGLGALSAQRTGADVGDIARQYAAQQAGAGAGYAAGATSPAAMQSYMSPYMQNVVDVQQQAAQRQADIASQARKAQFAQAGAFGGARQGIADAQAAAELARQKQGIQAQGLQQAFQQAQLAQQFGAGLGLQGLVGAQQGLGNILSGGQLGLSGIGQAIAGQQAGLSGLGQAGQMYGLGMQGAGLGMQGAGVGLQGVGQALGAGQLGLAGAGIGLQGTAQGMQGAGLGMQGVGQAINAGQLGLQGAGVGLQGTGQGMQGAGVGLQGVGQALGAGQLGIQGTGLGLQGAGMGMQGAGVGLQGVQGGLGGYGLLGQQAGVMGNLGAQELAARQGIIGLQSQLGGLEQQREQNIINQAIQTYSQGQQNPMQQFNAINALLRGYAIPGQTSTMYQAAPSMPAQLAGLGMGAYGLSRMFGGKKGGVVKSMAEGGFAAIDDKVRNNPTKYSEEQIKRSTANDVIDPQTAAIALSEIARAKKAAAGISALSSGLPAQGFAPGGIVAFEDGGKVERYQNQGLVGEEERPETIAERRQREWVESQQKAGAQLDRLRRMLFSSPERFRYSQQGELGPGQTYDMMGNVVPRPPKPVTPPPPPPAAPAPSPAAPSPAAAPAAPPSPTGGIAPSGMSYEQILDAVEKARSGASVPGLAGVSLSQLTPETLRARRDALMPEGEAAYRTPVTPLQEALAEEAKGAAKSRLEENQKIADRLDALRTSQESRFKAKEKDLETDRSRSVGIAFLEAAQAMTQPGQSFLQGLTRSAAAGGRRMLEEKERLDKRADVLAEAMNRLDEARLGDARERAAAKADYDKALLDVRKSLVDNAVTAFNMTRQDANQQMAMIGNREAQVADLGIKQLALQQQAQDSAARNAIGAISAAAALKTAEKPNPQLEIYQAALDNPKLAALLTKNDKGFSDFTDFIKANPQLSMQPLAKQLEAFMLAKQMFNPTVYSSAQPPANAIPYTPPAR